MRAAGCREGKRPRVAVANSPHWPHSATSCVLAGLALLAAVALYTRMPLRRRATNARDKTEEEQGRARCRVQMRKTKMTSGPSRVAPAQQWSLRSSSAFSFTPILPPSPPSSRRPRRRQRRAHCTSPHASYDQENGLKTPPAAPSRSGLLLVLVSRIYPLLRTARLHIDAADIRAHTGLGEGAVGDPAHADGGAPGSPVERLISPIRLHHTTYFGNGELRQGTPR